MSTSVARKPTVKGIIWIENAPDDKSSYLNKIVNGINTIEKEDSNQSFTQYSWINKDANRSYQLFFTRNASYESMFIL